MVWLVHVTMTMVGKMDGIELHGLLTLNEEKRFSLMIP